MRRSGRDLRRPAMTQLRSRLATADPAFALNRDAS
jgi:hypothetical protein